MEKGKTSLLHDGDGANSAGSSGVGGCSNDITIAKKSSYTMNDKMAVLDGASHNIPVNTVNEWKRDPFYIYAAVQLELGHMSIIVSYLDTS